ncbi:hypothetical protein BC828DRAFT_391734 [Blastocladiella britannica]|nr:hypothetical protein BC828DRAFT_391734 [Blastocladiella britannica]
MASSNLTVPGVRLVRLPEAGPASDTNTTPATGLFPHSPDDPLVVRVCVVSTSKQDLAKDKGIHAYVPNQGIVCAATAMESAAVSQVKHQACMSAKCYKEISTGQVASEQCALDQCLETWTALSSSVCVPLDLPFFVSRRILLPALPPVPGTLSNVEMALLQSTHEAHRTSYGLPARPPADQIPAGSPNAMSNLPNPLNMGSTAAPSLGICLPTAPIGFPCATQLIDTTSGGFPSSAAGPIAYPETGFGSASLVVTGHKAVLATNAGPQNGFHQMQLSTLYDPRAALTAPFLMYSPASVAGASGWMSADDRNLTQTNLYSLLVCQPDPANATAVNEYVAALPPGAPCTSDAACRFSRCIDGKCSRTVQKGDPAVDYSPQQMPILSSYALAVTAAGFLFMFCFFREPLLHWVLRGAAIARAWVSGSGTGGIRSTTTVQRELTLKPANIEMLDVLPCVNGGDRDGRANGDLPLYEEDAADASDLGHVVLDEAPPPPFVSTATATVLAVAVLAPDAEGGDLSDPESLTPTTATHDSRTLMAGPASAPSLVIPHLDA